MTPTYEQIKPYIEQGYVTERSHPQNEDVKIFNYTMECQFDKKWDDVTMHCRGLIINTATGEVLARPFKKFFNLDEHFHMGFQLPNEEPHVLEKMDGSLGILYYLNDTPMIATRGSFVSEQAQWATDYFNQHFAHDEEFKKEAQGKTYLFEIIYPANRIVVDYDFSGLVLLAIMHIDEPIEYVPEAHHLFPVVKHYPYEPLSKLKKHTKENAEGYVLHYASNHVRVKIKFEEYVRLHKIVTGLSERGIWEMLVEHGINLQTRDVLKNIPDEFHKWMDGVIAQLRKDYNAIDMDARGVIREIEKKGLVERKDQAIYINDKCSYPGVAFAMLDNKDYKSAIFKLIRPSAPNTFKVDM